MSSLSLVSFQGQIRLQEVVSFRLQTQKGWMEVLEGHQNFWLDVLPGFVFVKSQGSEKFFQTLKGFFEVNGDQWLLMSAAVEEVHLSDRVLYEEEKEELEKERGQLSEWEHVRRLQWLRDRIALCDKYAKT